MTPYALAIFLSAFLLFTVELLMGKFILPWFGGAPAVWTTCMLFFQVLLLGGYAYAHYLARLKSMERQRTVHLALLALSLGLMAFMALQWGSPILPSAGLKPTDSSFPVPRILLILTLSIGLPFLILSSNGPLIQAWFSKAFPTAKTYRLYSLSNLGSLLGLLSYPFIIEPRLALKSQGLTWAIGYFLFSGLVAWCAWRAGKTVIGECAPTPVPAEPSADCTDNSALPSIGTRVLWILLPATASVMLLATTNQMCQEVAVIPFLWVVPLVLYLLSFIICFDSERWYRRGIFMPMLAVAMVASTAILYISYRAAITWQIPILSLTVFAAAMVCHGELARLKPGMKHLTLFYFFVSIGGALGGIFVAFVAPFIFKGFWEFHLGLMLTGVLTLVVLVRDRQSWLYYRYPIIGAVVVLVLALLQWVLPVIDDWKTADDLIKAFTPLWAVVLVVGGVVVGMVVTIILAKREMISSFLMTLVFLMAALGLLGYALVSEVSDQSAGALRQGRNFFGVLTVTTNSPDTKEELRYRLRHGRISHGLQYRDEKRRRIVTTYYHPKSGVGVAIVNHPKYRAKKPIRIGVVGLGVGTIAAYGRPGDTIRFYEINPLVAEMVHGEKAFFTYLNDCRSQMDLVMGDARLTLERELREGKPQNYDVLAIDAFSSDSIPVHLLTLEALELYLKHLNLRDGVLALHITNRHLNLQPIVWGLAGKLGLHGIIIDDDTSNDMEWGSTWVLLAKNPRLLEEPGIARAATERDEQKKSIRLWTDDYSNLFQLLKWGD